MDSQSEFFNKAWIRASKSHLTRQNAQTLDDLIDFKGLLKDLEVLKKALQAPNENPQATQYKTYGAGNKFVQASFFQISQEIESVKEEETRLIEELKLFTFLEMKAEIFKERVLMVKFIEENEKKLEEKGCSFNINSLHLDTYKPIERFDLLNQIALKFSSNQVKKIHFVFLNFLIY